MELVYDIITLQTYNSDFSPALAGFDVTSLITLLFFVALCFAVKKSEVTPMGGNTYVHDFAWDMVKDTLKNILPALGVALG
ncbi:hypothetical protein FO511_29950 [Bacillus paranthracis]|uniref:hypothetical protein n=1 Tax=Bacillus paranthracis TaxID=2026186 RepID=UPI00283CE405|nr:hypothetical protein [Bacillus paranthracis]MDR4144984.1 hypothetical protein [Bacillus paranthracis]